MGIYDVRVFDNEVSKVWAFCLDQNASIRPKTGIKSSLSMGHFDDYYKKTGLKQF